MPAERTSVWLSYDQDQLDAQYDQRVLVPDADDYMARHLVESTRVRKTLDCRLEVPYGPTTDEVLDIFPAATRDAPVVVYYHGGAWTRWHKDHNSYQAPAFVGAGINFVSVNFSLVPAVNLDELVRQCRAAFAWTHAHAGDFGADPEQFYVAGHSSGGHLAGMLATTDWRDGWGLPENVIKGAFAASGIFDLEPVRLSSRNQYLHLDERAARRNSPIHHILGAMPPLVIAYGGGELDEFRRQSANFAGAVSGDGHACKELDLPSLNHFEVGESYADPNSVLMKAVLEVIRNGENL